MDALLATQNGTTTANGAAAFKPTLDAFTGLSQTTAPKDIPMPFEQATPALTLRVIWNVRSIHEGKRS
jgi:hypothetical protein